MNIVHIVKASALYPRVVISSLAKRLENLLFAILTPLLVYGPEITTCRLQRFTMGHMSGLAKVVCGTIAMLRFPRVVALPQPLLHHVGLSE
jgi:hypothetical protein